MDQRPMHRVFNIPEVVQEIVAHCEEPSLTALARTAGLFERPAYERLYSSVRDRSLSSLAVRMLQDSGRNESGAPSLSRYYFQASLIRTVHMTSSIENTITYGDLQTALILLRRPLFPFPFLKKISVMVEELDAIGLVDLLLCPSLERLEWTIRIESPTEFSLWERQIAFFLEGLSTKASHLSHLEFGLDFLDRDAEQAFGSKLANLLGRPCRSLPKITHILANVPIHPELLRDLACIDTLRSIELGEPSHPLPAEYTGVHRVGGFRCLKFATLVGNLFISDIVQAMQGADLQVLSLQLSEWGPRISLVFDAICNFAHTLKGLAISPYLTVEDGSPWESFHPYTISKELFASLSTCAELKFFRFGCYDATETLIDIDIALLEHLAKSWTSLETLDIYFGQAKLSTEAFVPFSLYCPRLSNITLGPLVSTLSLRLPPALIPPHPWKRLFVGYTPSFLETDSATTVAVVHYLDALWNDVHLEIRAEPPGLTKSGRGFMNEALDGLRIGRAMRHGSRWRVQHSGETWSVGDAASDMRSGVLAKVCPWEIVN